MTASLNASKELEGKAKFGFGKERKQTASVVCYEILGGALSITKSLSSSNPSNLILNPSRISLFFTEVCPQAGEERLAVEGDPSAQVSFGMTYDSSPYGRL